MTIKPMLAESIDIRPATALINDPEWYAQQKLDGDRVMIHILDGTVTALNRQGEPRRNPVPAKVLAQFSTLPGEWYFDGELLGDTLWLFDLPAAGDFVGPQADLEFRLAVLEGFFATWSPDPCVRLLKTARTPEAKLALLTEVRDRGAEGIILKHVAGPYRSGRRSPQMLKAKFTHTVDAVVSRVRPDGRENCYVAVFEDGQPVEIGSVALQGKGAVHRGDVIEVRYLYASIDDGGAKRLYQPRMVKVRTDKAPGECTIDQLQFTDRSVVNFRTPSANLIRQQHLNKATGTVVTVYDLAAPDAPHVHDGERWLTACEDHEFSTTSSSLRRARQLAASPWAWCVACQPADKTLEFP